MAQDVEESGFLSEKEVVYNFGHQEHNCGLIFISNQDWNEQPMTKIKKCYFIILFYGGLYSMQDNLLPIFLSISVLELYIHVQPQIVLKM